MGLVLRSMNAEGEVNAVEAVPCVYARLSATDAWVIRAASLMVWVFFLLCCPVLPEDELSSCKHAQAWKYTKVSPQALFFFQQGDRQHSTQHLSDLFFFSSSLTSVFQIWLCTHSSAPHMAINNERVTRSMWPCKIQHNAASVTSDVIVSSPYDLRVNVISIQVNVWRRFNPEPDRRVPHRD